MNDNEDSEASISSSSLSVLNWLTSTLKQSFTILSISFQFSSWEAALLWSEPDVIPVFVSLHWFLVVWQTEFLR